MRAITFEQVVRLFTRDEAVAVATRTAIRACFAFSLNANTHAVFDTGGNFDSQFCFLASEARCRGSHCTVR